MSEGKRKREGGRDKSRRRYHYDGTVIRQTIDGPSVWVTCVRGKEKQAVGELYDLFEHLAAEMWPEEGSADVAGASKDSDSDDDNDGDIEKQIAKEMSSMKRPRKETRFASCRTDTSCFVVISCKAPVDPVKLVVKHVENIVKSGITHTKFAQRLTPISATCVTNIQEVKALCTRLLEPFIADGKTFTYKVELRMRNHNTLTRSTLVQELAKCVPEACKVNLENPEVFILVEIFKSTCGIGIVRDYYRLQKFNVMEIAKAEEPGFKQGEGRLAEKSGNKPENVAKTSSEETNTVPLDNM